MLAAMIDLYKLIWWAFAGLFRSRAALEAEILVLRHQLNVLRRKSPGRLAFSSIDRLALPGRVNFPSPRFGRTPRVFDSEGVINGIER